MDKSGGNEYSDKKRMENKWKRWRKSKTGEILSHINSEKGGNYSFKEKPKERSKIRAGKRVCEFGEHQRISRMLSVQKGKT